MFQGQLRKRARRLQCKLLALARDARGVVALEFGLVPFSFQLEAVCCMLCWFLCSCGRDRVCAMQLLGGGP